MDGGCSSGAMAQKLPIVVGHFPFSFWVVGDICGGRGRGSYDKVAMAMEKDAQVVWGKAIYLPVSMKVFPYFSN